MSEIWMVNHYAITPDLPGGTRHFELGSELAAQGFRVKIFASDVSLLLRKHTKLKSGELYRTEKVGDVEFVWVSAAEYQGNDWRRIWNMLSFAWNVNRVAGRLAREGRPDAIIGSSPHPFAAVAAHRVAKRLGARFFLELRDLWPQALIDMGGTSEKSPGIRVMRMLEKYLYARAEYLIILARGSRDYLVERGVPEERIVFLPNGVHLGQFRTHATRAESRARYGFERFTAVYAGAHGPANSLETILGAAAILRDHPVEFVLVGDGACKAALVESARENGLDNVRFMSPVPKNEIPDLLSAADAGVITLKNARAFAYAVSPNKLFDYMAASCPVVCSVPGDMAAMVAEAGAGITAQPESPQALADAVEQLRGMPVERRAALGAAGRAYLERSFRREVLAGRLTELLRQARGPSRTAAVPQT